MRNYFTFNGVDSRDYGIYISGTGRLTIPEKAYNFQEIPGRSGDLIVNASASVRNDTIVYPAFIARQNFSGVYTSYAELVGALRSWLLSVKGYAELRDSYDPDHYRLAAFAGPTQFETAPVLDAGSFDLEFVCKPQRYLTAEDEATTIRAGASAKFKTCGYKYSDPLFTVSGVGSFQVDSQTVTIVQSLLTYPITIDCRLMECFDANGENANRYVSFSEHNFPKIYNGTIVTAGTAALTVKPRWYEL